MTGRQEKQLSEALRAAFSKTKLEQMLRYRLDLSLEDIALGDDYEEIVFKVIRSAVRSGWEAKLIIAAREANPGSVKLYEFAEQFNLTSVPQELAGTRLESIVRASNPFLDFSVWLKKLGEIEPRVCRIEPYTKDKKMRGGGTGFLIGPDTVLTNYHVVEEILNGLLSPEDVVLRFDFKQLPNSVSVNEGVEFRLSADWLFDHSLYSESDLLGDSFGKLPALDELDYAVLRVAGDPGNRPIGGDRATPGDPSRGWIKIPPTAYDFQPKAPLVIVQHPSRAPLKLAIDTNSIIGVNRNRTRVGYKTNTEPGSSGSPCFSVDLELVALHHSGDLKFKPIYNQGIPIENIARLLTERGKSAGIID